MSSPARQRILDAVVRVIGTDGVGAVTNRRIASEADVSLGSITYHFATQQDMLRSAMVDFVMDETRKLEEQAEQYRSAGVDVAEAARLVQHTADKLAFTNEQIATFELYIHAGRDPELREAAARSFAAYDELAVSILTALGTDHARHLAPVVVATVTGLQLRRLATGGQDIDVAAALLTVITGAQATENG
ncbi:TetR family transcriptional regulator [Hoyosella rhizosphaerae]|nr:TetR family transcriptional regulator [Hoyosella rhizosphaerae]MBN4927146.1 TetR family transcriptional regulator [Hoyosella rhizosphaerae]